MRHQPRKVVVINSKGSSSNGSCCGVGLIQGLIVAMCIGQCLLIGFLVTNHNLFQDSLDSLRDLTSNLIHGDKPSSGIQGVISSVEYNQRTNEMSRPLASGVTRVDYTNYPVVIKSVGQDDFVPTESKPIVRKLLGSLIDVNFPDLMYRSKGVVRSQYPRIFEEIRPFVSEFKNPCWLDESDAWQCLPYVYVLGQPKCGTSDLYERMKAHQDIIMPNRKEIRWFTRGEFITHPMWHEGLHDENIEQVGEPMIGPDTSIVTFTRAFRALEHSLRDMTKANEHKITLDGGPHTFWWPTQGPDGAFQDWDVPPQQLLREIQPDAKFILTLADPVRRMYSDYYFLEDNLRVVRPGGATSKSAQQFHDRAVEQVETFRLCVKNYVQTLRADVASHHYVIPNSDSDILTAVKDSLPLEYHDVLPLWFRASQMCAHDRHAFGVGGHGRLSIGLYVLYLEKWLEHFALSQFLVLRLEDYETDPRGHMKRVFDFLQLGEPQDWNRVLLDRHFNEHKVVRESILEETETLLREFHQPYNALLAAVLQDPKFLWECPVVNGVKVTLRSKQAVEARKEPVSAEDRGRLAGRDPDAHEELTREERLELHNAHGVDRHATPPIMDDAPPIREDAPHFDLIQGRLRRRGEDPMSQSKVALTPMRFDDKDLPVPADEDLDRVNIAAMSGDLTTAHVGKEVCTAAFMMDTARLKAWFLEIGVPGDVSSDSDGKRNGFHCLAALYTMGEAHSRSHVFAELKGKETWLSRHFDPPLEIKMASVLSQDIIDHLSAGMLKTARWLHRAGVPMNAQDRGGNTPLHIAALGGELALVKFLVENGADVNLQNADKRTPLHYAAAYGHAELCAVLIQGGGQTDIHDMNGVTPMDIIANPGPILRDDAKRYLNIDQRPARSIERRLNPELHPTEAKVGWKHGTGGWSTERLKGFETDMECDVVDQYFADEITGEEIFKNYLAHNAPVLIRGLLDDWKVADLYQMEQLLEDHGELNVQVSDIPYAQKFGGGQQVTMTLREYIEEVKAHEMLGGNHPWYVFKGHPIPGSSDRADSLVKYETCPIPDPLYTAFLQAAPPGAADAMGKNKRTMFVNAQWALGGAGTGAPIHFHNTAWAALVYGSKKWLIYPPHHMIMSNRQILDFFETERESFAQRDVRPVTCVQTAGDVMIIPESWGHGVLNIQETIAIATEYKHSVWRLKPPVHTVSAGAAGFDNRVDRSPPAMPELSSKGRKAMLAKKRYMGG